LWQTYHIKFNWNLTKKGTPCRCVGPEEGKGFKNGPSLLCYWKIPRLPDDKSVSNFSVVGLFVRECAFITSCKLTWSEQCHFEILKTWKERASYGT
jgi:hypothetical protein